MLTFDDSSPGQFRYVDAQRHPGDRSQVGRRRPGGVHPREAGLRPGGDVLRAAGRQPARTTSSTSRSTRAASSSWLVEQGYEIGNHTLWHANLGKYDEATVRPQLAEAQVWVQRHVPDYKLPHASRCRTASTRRTSAGRSRGTAKGTSYRHDGDPDGRRRRRAVAVRARPSTRSACRASRPSSATCATGSTTSTRTPADRFVSDGDADDRDGPRRPQGPPPRQPPQEPQGRRTLTTPGPHATSAAVQPRSRPTPRLRPSRAARAAPWRGVRRGGARGVADPFHCTTQAARLATDGDRNGHRVPAASWSPDPAPGPARAHGAESAREKKEASGR